MGIGTFYHFYPSKEALLLDLRRDLFDETASDLTARFISVTLTDGESLIQALELLMQNLIAIAQRYRGLERAVASACLDNPGFAVEIRTQEMVVENLIREVLIANSRVLKPLDAGAAARSILILVEGVVARSMREPDLAKEPTKVVKEVARMLARYLLLPRGRLAS